MKTKKLCINLAVALLATACTKKKEVAPNVSPDLNKATAYIQGSFNGTADLLYAYASPASANYGIKTNSVSVIEEVNQNSQATRSLASELYNIRSGNKTAIIITRKSKEINNPNSVNMSYDLFKSYFSIGKHSLIGKDDANGFMISYYYPSDANDYTNHSKISPLDDQNFIEITSVTETTFLGDKALEVKGNLAAQLYDVNGIAKFKLSNISFKYIFASKEVQ